MKGILKTLVLVSLALALLLTFASCDNIISKIPFLGGSDTNEQTTTDPAEPTTPEKDPEQTTPQEHTHTIVIDEAKAPTCTETGLTEGQHCSVCDEVLIAQEVIDANGHDYKAVVTDPTCTTDGFTTYTCHCGDTYVADEVKAEGHKYEAVVTDPTCTEDGYTTYTCFCGHSYVADEVKAEGHKYEAVVTDPTCTEDGYTTYTCFCGHSYVADEVKAEGHKYEAVVTAPTCTEDGFTTYTCHCGHSYVGDEIKANGHKYETAVTAPTCTEGGFTTYTCSVCSDSYKADTVAPSGHKYEATVTAPTCTEGGFTTYTCAVCGDFYVANEVKANGHDYKAVVTKPTCTEDGFTTYTCHCGDTYVADEVEKNGHDYKAVVTKPTCTEGGFTTYTCHCGDTYVADEVEADGHDYKAVVTEPTCTEDGFTTYTCAVCGDFYVANEVKADGHKYEAVVTAPTCTEGGFTTYTCHCNDSYVADKVDALDHTEVIDEAVAPTCTETGLTEGKHCSVCDEVLVHQTVVDELGHTEVVDKAVAPDCTNTGLTEGKHCSVCGEVLVAQEEVEADGHTEETIPAVDATCTETGLTAGVKCSICGEILTEQEETPKLGHTRSEWITDKEATYEEDGAKHIECTVCHEILETSKIPQLHHNYVHTVTPPTCTAAGYTTHYCDECGDEYQDTFVDPLGHSYGEWKVLKAATCTTTGLKEAQCSACESRQTETIPALGHTEITLDAVAPTCTETGLTEGKYCTTCKTTTVEQKVEDALGHDYKEVVTAPTCTEGGFTTYTCATCGDSYKADEVKALGHTEVIDEAIAPTCTKTGRTEGKHCSVCEEVLVAQTVVNALGHTEEIDKAVAPTCTETGLTAGKHCSVCDYVIVAQQVVDALGHKEEEIPAVAPSCTATGLTAGVKCSVCGDILVEQEEVDALGHKEEEIPAVAPSCTETGLTAGVKCSVCGEILVAQEEVKALGHDYEKVVTDPTCTEGGFTTYTCHCNDSYVADKFAALGHKYEATVTAPTCTEKGFTTYACANCDHFYTDNEVAETGHDYSKVVVTAPACTEKGYTTYTCAVCDDSYKADEVDALGHTDDDDDYLCEICGEIAPPAADSVLTIEQAIKLGKLYTSTYSTDSYYVTGIITEVYNTTYGNMYITDGTNIFTIYGTYSADGETRYDKMTIKPVAGDRITIYGSIGQYNGAAQIRDGWMTDLCKHNFEETDRIEANCKTEGSVTYVCSDCDHIKVETVPTTDHNYKFGVCTECGIQGQFGETSADISFADTTNRTDFSTSIQVWEQNGIIVTNKKASSTNNVANYANPVRFYKSSTVTIAYPGMTKIVINATSGYVDGWMNVTTAGATATKDGTTVTIVFENPVDSITITMSAQARASKITVTASMACEHNEVVVDAVDATCTETGLTEGSRCLICGEWFVKQEEIPALGHSFGDWIVDKEATEDTDGHQYKVCSVCEAVEEETIPKLSHEHKYTTVVTAPTCTEKGYTTYTCACGNDTYIADEVPATGHTYESVVTAPTCTKTGYTTYTCHCSDTYTADEVAALDHADANNDYLCDYDCKTVVAPAADSVLTIEQAIALGKVHAHDNYTEGKYTVTGVITEVYNTQYGNMYITDGNGNTLTIYGTYDAEGKVGYNSMTTKPVAGDIVTIYGIVGQYKDTAQIKNGWIIEVIVCEHTTQETIPAVEATCTATGLTEGKKCTDCGRVLIEQTVVDALGHTTENGTCDRCGEEINGETPDVPTFVTVSKTHTEMTQLAGVSTSSTGGSVNGKNIALDENITVVFAKGGSTSNPAYYSESIRLYQNGATLTIKGTGMKTIVITLANNAAGDGPIAVTGGTADNANTPTNYVYTITVDEGVSEVVITTKGTDKNSRLYVANIEVAYAVAGSGNEGGETACEHTNTTTTTVDATCTKAGSTTVTCDDCSKIVSTAEIAATGHSYGEWVETTAPTCTEKGEQSKTCSACGDVQTETILATGHNFADGTCTGCGESEADAPEVEPIGKKTYTFSNYAAGTQYAKNEVHELDEYVTVTTTEAHFTSELRLYSSSTHNGYAIFETAAAVKGISFNAGNKVDTINVYGSIDGETWVLIEGVSITTTSYKDYTVNIPADSAYTHIKLDVAGTQQIRIQSITFDLA